MGGAVADVGGGVDQHVQHHRGGAEEADPVAADGFEDGGRLHAPQADVGAGQRRHGPREAPAVAVEHGQRPQIDRVRRHAAGQHVAGGVQVGAAMVIEHALGIAGGARGVVQAEVVPFVPRPFPGRVGRLRGEPGFVLRIAQVAVRAGVFAVFDAHGARRRAQVAQHLAHQRRVFAVVQQHGGAAVLQDERQRARVQAGVERVQHRAGHRHAEVRFVQGRRIGRQHRHHVAAAHAPGGQRRGHLAATVVGGVPILAMVAVQQRGALRVDGCRPLQEAQRRQGLVVGGVAGQRVGRRCGHDALLLACGGQACGFALRGLPAERGQRFDARAHLQRIGGGGVASAGAGVHALQDGGDAKEAVG